MKSELAIKRRLKQSEQLADGLLAQSLKEGSEEGKNMRLRQRSKVMEEIYTLRWVLGEK